jgi:PKD repeat protein
MLSAQVIIQIKPGQFDNKDTYVNSYNYYGQGSTPSFIAAAWSYGGEFGIGRSFIDIPLPVLPEHYSNFKASLNFFYNYSATHVGHAGDNGCIIERVIQPWAEDYMNWSNQPGVTSSSSVFIESSIENNQDYEAIDVTQLVMDMYSFPESSFGFRLSLITEDLYRSMIFASGDHPDERVRPFLLIEYDTCSFPENFFTYQVEDLTCFFNYNDTTSFDYHWDFGNGFNSNLQNPEFEYNSEGIFFVCLNVTNSCGTISVCDSVFICRAELPVYTYTIDSNRFSFSPTTSGDSYFWDFGNGYFSSKRNPDYVFPDAGLFYVCLTITDTCGTNTYCDSIYVSQTLGISDLPFTPSVLSVYPNPSKGDFYIDVSDQSIRNIEIINVQGSVIQSNFNLESNSKYHVNLQQFASGLHFLRITTQNGVILHKIILN